MALFSVEGNIGAGKSTIIEHLKKYTKFIRGKDVIFIDEPVQEWQTVTDKSGKTMLELFYTNPSKYAFSFQMMAYISRLAMIEQAMKKNPDAIFITERCLLSDYEIFAQMLYEQGNLLEEEFTIYKKWFDYFNTIEIAGFIYIKCDPKTAFDRCISRNRQGETINFDYIDACHNKHEKWLQHEESPVLILNNETLEIDDAMFEIEDFIMDEMEVRDEVYPPIVHVYNKKNLALALGFIFYVCFQLL
jgi:deoxyadenosine/deoxycytidine kinase